MDCQDYTTFQAERARGQHLKLDDRGAIQRLHKLGYSNRAIAREMNCSPTTIGKELSRGTPAHPPGRRGAKTSIFCSTRASNLRSKSKPLPQTAPHSQLRGVHPVCGEAGSRASLVARRLRGLRKIAWPFRGRRDRVHQNALQRAASGANAAYSI